MANAIGSIVGKLAKAGKTYADSMQKSTSKSGSGDSGGSGSSDIGRKVGTAVRKAGSFLRKRQRMKKTGSGSGASAGKRIGSKYSD